MIFGDNKRRGYAYNIAKSVLAWFWVSFLGGVFVGVLILTMY